MTLIISHIVICVLAAFTIFASYMAYKKNGKSKKVTIATTVIWSMVIVLNIFNIILRLT